MQPFSIPAAEKRKLASALGLNRLPAEIDHAIAHAISAYKATTRDSAGTTVGNTLAALRELEKKGRTYEKAVARLADDRCGVDYTTHEVLQPLARDVLDRKPGSREALARAARVRAAKLEEHKRVDPRTECLRFFCGVLRQVFNHAAAPALRRTVGGGWYYCRQFALEVFAVACIDHADFDAHPERLTEYLGTDVSVG